MTLPADTLRRVANGENMRIELVDGRGVLESCAWCIPIRGARTATLCEVAAVGSTPMCSDCLAMYAIGESESELAEVKARVRDRVLTALALENEARGRARLAAFTVGAVATLAVAGGFVALCFCFAMAWRALQGGGW